MKKDILIKKIHKALYIYEDYGFENYQNYLSRLIINLHGLQRQRCLDSVILSLTGLRNIGGTIEQEDIRGVIIKAMNILDKYYEEV